MNGSLALRQGVLYAGWHAKSAWLRAFDLAGQALSPAIHFRDPAQPYNAAAGLDVDPDHRLWMADTPAARLRCFNLFGRENLSIREREGSAQDGPGSLRLPMCVACQSGEDGLRLWVGLAGSRRCAVQCLSEQGQPLSELRSQGDARGLFRGVRRVRCCGRLLYVCETLASQVQVFRDGDFHFSFRLPAGPGRLAAPSSVAPLADGRALVTTRAEHSALLLVDAAGRVTRVLARAGSGPGEVHEPSDVVVQEGASDGGTRFAVIDRDGERVQVFGLEGRCHGAIDILAG